MPPDALAAAVAAAPESPAAAAAPAAAEAAPASPSASSPAPVADSTPAAESTGSVAEVAPAVEASPAAPAAAPEVTPAAEPAKADAAKPADTSLLGAAEVPAEPAPESPAPVVFDAFTLPEGVELDQAKVGAFTGILAEMEAKGIDHAAAQEFGQKFLDMYIAERTAEAQGAYQAQVDAYNAVRAEWKTQFQADPEIGGDKATTTIKHCAEVRDAYARSFGQQAPERLKSFTDMLALTGAGDHPEMVRFVNWMSDFVVEKSRMVAATTPKAPVVPKSRAERLYSKTQTLSSSQ